MADALLGVTLRSVSRSFYLSLAVLPRTLREPVGLAYLLARAADTVADTRAVPRAERLAHLAALRQAYAGAAGGDAGAACAAAAAKARAPERRLLASVDAALARVAALDPDDRARVRRVLDTLTSGMVFDLERFPGEDATELAALDTMEDLDRYVYLVAGCVGEFWTELHAAHRPRLAGWRPIERGVRFGKALQLTNVLRDVPGDLRQGRCYLPAGELQRLGLAPADLLDPAGAARARPLLQRLLAVALEHYDAALDYTLTLPRAEWRTRLACLWPIMIGLATLQALAAHPNPLAAAPPVKISRAAVRGIVARSMVLVWSNRALRADAARRRALA
jgi:farnesyl-diphosphate farnesyltransferase